MLNLFESLLRQNFRCGRMLMFRADNLTGQGSLCIKD
ncbi:MAG: hypothetical protein BWY61_00884 [Firmicutes bacterium ADurb.Bin354]|nr:MAG: hypothetical protein BWY61_00884 [Firmicutes bacterium ADurb.Bin354]